MDFHHWAMPGWDDVANAATFVLVNKIARAIGMMLLVFAIIWIIALVYSGYAQDSDFGPIALRPHTNKKLGESTIVFDQSMYPFQMHGVEATCRVYYRYEGADGKPKKVLVLGPRSLTLNIRVSPIPPDENTIYGFETKEDVGALPQTSVLYPVFDPKAEPRTIEATPATVREYVELNKLEEQWTEDDTAPLVSLGPAQIDLIAEARKAHIEAKSQNWVEAQTKKLFGAMSRSNAAKDRANVFGSYYLKLQFSKRPDFVLFKHPNRELKMTAWLTLLTSVFSLAMDLWPVDRTPSAPATHAERTAPGHAPLNRRPS